MLYAQFLRWAGKWALGKQKYLNKVWQEATKGGKQVLESHFPKLLSKAKNYYNEFKGFTPKVVPKTKITPDKVTKIPTKFKTPPVQPKRYPIFANPTSQEAMIFFREYGKKQQGIYGPFGKGTDGFRNMMQWVGVNSPKEVMKVMKQYGYKPKVVPPGKAEGGIASLENGGLSIPDDMDYPEWFNLLQGPKTEEWPVDPALLASAPEGELFMMEEFLQAVKDGFKGTYDEYIDQIDRSPRDYLQEGGSPHFSKRGPRYEIDTSFGGVDSKYYSASIPEGIEMLKGDIKDLARKYWRSAKMKEGEWGKFPPLPISLAGLVSLIPAMRLLKPIKGLYELEKKTGGLGVSMFKTIAGDKSRRAFLQNMIGNTKRFKDAQLKEMFKKAAEAGKRKASKFKWEPTGPGSKFYNKLQEILAKHSTKHAKGGRIGFDEGGSTQKEIDKALVAIEKLKSSLMPESYEALIEIYKDKQKDLNIDIMESAGGLGEMLGEGGRAGLKKGGRIGFQRAGSVPYLSRGWSQPGVYKAPRGFTGMQDILGIGGTGGILALRQKDKDKKTPQKKEGPNYPEPKPPFKKGDLIIDFILANRRQPKRSEELRLKEILRVAKEKAEGITSLFNENLHGINTQRFVEGAQDAPQKLLEDLVEIKEKVLDPKTNKVITQYNTYKRSDKTRPPTEEELEDDYAELWSDEQDPWDFGSTIEELDAALEEQRSYERYMYDQYKTGKLDKYMSMDAKLERVLDADSAGRPSGYDVDEEYEIRAYGEEKERIAIAKMNEAEEIARGKASGSPWYTDPKIPSPEEELRKEFPGIDDKTIRNILADKDPERVANVKESLRKALDMTMQGKNPEGIIKILKEQYPKAYAEDVWEIEDPKFADFFDYPRHPSGKRMSTREVIKWKETNPKAYAEWRAAMKKRADKAAKKLEDKTKKAAGGPVGLPPEVFGPLAPKKIPSPIPLPPTDEPSPRPNTQKFRDPYWQYGIRLPAKEKPGKTVDPREGIGLDAFGDIDVDISDPRFKFGRYDPKKDYYPWEFEVGKDSAGVKWKKRFNDGGIARRPNAVPPLSGPTPQGLTFLLGDDIVKNRIT